MTFIPRVVSAVALYLALALSANASDIASAKAALSGSMEKLRFHESPKTMPFVRFTTFDGAPMSLADYNGKLLVVNFWATWCGPCRKEMPMLSELQETLGSDAFEVVTIATGRNSPAGMQRFFDQAGVTNLPLHRDPKQKLARAMGVTGLPTTVVMDADGREIARMQGEADWASQSAQEMIKALLPQS